MNSASVDAIVVPDALPSTQGTNDAQPMPAAATTGQTTPTATTATVSPLTPPLGELDAAQRRFLRFLPFVAVAFGAAAGAVLLWVWNEHPRHLPALGTAIGALFSGGKEASIPLAAGYGVPTWLVGLTIFLVDVAAVACMFPFLIRGLDHLETTKGFFGELLRVARKQADRRRKWVDRWGIAGLYLFSIVPFAFNGPPQGIVLGRLAGLRPTQIAAAVGSAMVTTTLAWTTVAYFAATWLSTINPKLPLYLSIVITVTVIVVAVWGVIKERRLAKQLAATTTD